MSPTPLPTPSARPPYLVPQLERLGRWNWTTGAGCSTNPIVCVTGQTSLFDLERRQ